MTSYKSILTALLCFCAAGLAAEAAIPYKYRVVTGPPDRRLKLEPFARQAGAEVYDGEESAKARLAGQLADAGYLSASVAVETAGAVVVFQVELGRPAIIGGWDFAGDDSLPPEQLRKVLPGPGTRLTRAALDRAVAVVLSLHENAGFPLAAVRPQALEERDGRIRPLLRVEAGPRVRVGFLEFAGKPGTKPALLAKTAGFAPRDYSRTAVTQWTRGLDQSGLVRVDSQLIVAKDSTYGLRFFVTGLSRNQVGAVAGFDAEAKRLTGSARVGLQNLFDTGRRLEGSWQSAWSKTAYGLSYTEPWVLGTPIALTGSVSQQTTDTTYSHVDMGLAASARVAPSVLVDLETGFDRFVDAGLAQAVSVVWAGSGLAVDTRDWPPNPRRGLRVTIATRVGNRTSGSAGTSVVTRAEAGADGAITASRSVVWAGAVAARGAFAGVDLSDPELYHLGGPRTVRGFRDDEFAAKQLGWASAELRLLPDRGSRVYPFVDAGAYDSDAWHFIVGYGAGARVATRAGLLGLDYGVAYGDSPLRGKVHLSFEAAF